MMHSFKSIYLIILVLFFPFCVSASNYYVDKNAIGNNNGTNWVNAWQSFSAINWNLIQPGDVIYISGGTDSTIYYEQLTIDKSGTKTNPITIIAGKYSPSPSGHSGRVIIDGGGTRTQCIYANSISYFVLKGFECRYADRGVYIEDNINNVIIDSLYIYNFYAQAGIFLNGNQTTYSVDSVTIRNCRIVSFDNYPGQTDGIYIQGAKNTVIHDNYVHIPNQDSVSHNDALQAYHSNGFIIYNNVFINDSVYSLEGGGIPIILGSEGNNPVIIYNNFIYMGGIWHPDANLGGALCTRWYNVNPMPPTWIIHNTVVVNGPNCRGIWQQYQATCVNNIIAMFSTAGGMSNLEVGELPSAAIVDSLRSNLFWSSWAGPDFAGQYTGNGYTGSVSGWTDWVNTFGGTGENSNPFFLNNIRQSNGYVIGLNSPARNAGEDLQALIESFGLPWSDIDGNLRDNSPDIGAYQYSSGSSTTFSLSVQLTHGYNLVSVPGINPDGMAVNTWWPYRDMNANVFRFSNGYQSVTTTTPGLGYWMKNSGDRIYNTGEEWPASGIEVVPHNPITVTPGWNLFGGYENIVSTSSLSTIPTGIIAGPVYKFSNGYQVATTLNPGYGYWVRMNASGNILIPETMAKGQEQIEWFPENWGRIIFTDAAGTTNTLYAVKGKVDLNIYELPPAPPEGMFDIRYGSGRIAEDINSSIQEIQMSGVTFPLTVRAEGLNMRLMDETGSTVNVNLNSGEEVEISDALIQKLIVTGELIPAAYALEQNYPNPFNPITVIEFLLPEDVSNVKLSIYNALGEKVAELVNKSLVAGKYQYQWNAKNVATGIYIYELRTDKFVSVKKMVVLK